MGGEGRCWEEAAEVGGAAEGSHGWVGGLLLSSLGSFPYTVHSIFGAWQIGVLPLSKVGKNIRQVYVSSMELGICPLDSCLVTCFSTTTTKIRNTTSSQYT